MDGSVLILNMDGKVLFSSSQARFLLGYDSQVGGNFYNSITSNLDLLVQKSFQLNPNETDELRIQLRDHGDKFFDLLLIGIEDFHVNQTVHQKCIGITFHHENFIHKMRKDIVSKTNAIETLSKSRLIREGELRNAIEEIIQVSAITTKTKRLSVWLIDENKTDLKCIGMYDPANQNDDSDHTVDTLLFPNYFKLFETQKIIVTENTFRSERTSELLEAYLRPKNIQSLMDVPIRIEGEIRGVICFENIGAPRVWTLSEQKYGLITAQFVSLAIESNERIKLQQKLEETLREKENFLKETFHRVKNNLSVISSLVNLQKSKIHAPEAVDQLEELSNRIQSISSLHDLLHESQHFDTVNMHDYLGLILQNLIQTASFKIELNSLIDPVILKSDQAILVGMIANELVTNAIKHAFEEINEAKLTILLTETDGKRNLTIADNGKGIGCCLSSASFGIDILDGLVEQLNGNIEYINQDGLSVRLTF